MSRNLKNSQGLLASAVFSAMLLSACAAEPTYSPPEGSRAAVESCPVGEVWVCRDHYPSRLERPGEVPMDCTCEDLRGVR